jgi:glutamate-1-semialdehyde 2,1-aminomutase
MNESSKWFDRAQLVMPGGVNSPVRAFRGVGGRPPVIARGEGCRVTDVDGRRYIDYVGSWGAMIVGHAHPEVVARITQTTRQGTSFGLLSTPEIELAEEIIRRVPGAEKVRLVNSGTEAVMSAIRLARGAANRPKIVKFEGCYHGHADALLVRAGSGVATLGLPDSPGVNAGAAADTLTAAYNDMKSVEALFADHGSEIAAVVVEPVAGNMGVVPPAANFLSRLREVTQRHGALLIFDEVMTGFRVARGGARDLFGIRPDLLTFGKVIGGGLPVGAYGGRADLMNLIAPAGPVYQAGTLAGNPVAVAAGLATLGLLDKIAYERLEQISARLESGLRAAIVQSGTAATVQRVGSMLTLFFAKGPVRNFAEARAADHQRFAKFFHAMLRRGVHLPPSGFEAWFVSLAHDEEAIDQTTTAARESLFESIER